MREFHFVIARSASRRSNPVLRTDFHIRKVWIASLALAMTMGDIATLVPDHSCAEASASPQGADDPVPFSFPHQKKWSAGRRQGFARPLVTNLCERFVRVPQRERIASPSREARAFRCGRFARPSARTLRLPALHRAAPQNGWREWRSSHRVMSARYEIGIKSYCRV